MIGLILAGGKGKRLGRAKTDVRLGSETLLERAVRQAAPFFDRLLVSVAEPRELGLPNVEIVPDAYPGHSALVGIASGLRAAASSVFVLAVDMPFLCPALIRRQLAAAPEFDAVVPRHGRFFEPLHAVYAPACLGPMERLLASGEQQIFLAYRDFRIGWIEEDEVRRLDPEGRAFFNINTPEDLARAERLVGG